MSKALALAAGFGEGYLGTKRQQKLDEERQEERELRLADARWQGEERERVRQDRARLADAVKPATVNDGAATLNMGDGAKVYDDAGVAGSDYRQARSMGLADVQTPTSTFAVNGKGFADRAAAEGAAAEYNAPKARDERITLAMAQTDPNKARQYEAQGQQIKASATSQKLNDMQVAERAWRQKVGEAMTGGFDSLADLVTQTEVGPLAGKKAKAVPSADGKSIVFNVIGDDGALTPVPSLTFPNDQTGVRMAGYMLDKTVTPQDRYTTWVNEEKSKASLARDAARDAETVRHNKVVEANGTTSANAAATRAAAPPPAPAGYRWTADGKQEAIPGGPAAGKSAGKPLPTKLATDLREQATIADSTERFVGTFKPEFAGKTITGDFNNTSKRVLGDDTGQAQWWQDYAMHRNAIRNKMFGSALTTQEKTEWEKADITPRMDAAQVSANLQRRAELEKTGMNRMMSSAAKGGYSVEQIEAETGRAIPKVSGPAAKAPTGSPKPPPANIPRVASTAEAAKLPSGTVFIDPNGVQRKVP